MLVESDDVADTDAADVFVITRPDFHSQPFNHTATQDTKSPTLTLC